ncbi:hypothetical protein ACINLE_06145 [Bacillus sp. z60-18]|uniref:hypothetical protein n=1 Tax=unclassified Bacillus (in: firmicutes) TaxID=185979 RepID=UPI00390CCF15
MNSELKDMLQSVLKEELNPVNQRLDKIDHCLNEMDQRLNKMDKRFDGVDQRLNKMDQRFDGMDQRFDGVDQCLNKMDQRFDGMDQRLNRLETDVKDLKKGQELLQKNIIESIGRYTDNITEYVDVKSAALNQRVFAVETEIQRLYKQSS